MKTLNALLLAVGLAAGSATAARAQEFDVSFGVFQVGEVVLRAETSGGRYDVDLAIRTTGLAGIARSVQFQGKASGREGNWPQPKRYREEVDTGRRVSSAELVWKDGTPDVTRYASDPADTVPAADEAARKGAIDPASAFFATLTGPPLCGKSFTVFDGQRLNAFSFTAAEKTETGVSCLGERTRVAGYSAEDLADQEPGADVTMNYLQVEGAWRFDDATVQTFFGKLRLKRR